MAVSSRCARPPLSCTRQESPKLLKSGLRHPHFSLDQRALGPPPRQEPANEGPRPRAGPEGPQARRLERRGSRIGAGRGGAGAETRAGAGGPAGALPGSCRGPAGALPRPCRGPHPQPLGDARGRAPAPTFWARVSSSAWISNSPSSESLLRGWEAAPRRLRSPFFFLHWAMGARDRGPAATRPPAAMRAPGRGAGSGERELGAARGRGAGRGAGAGPAGRTNGAAGRGGAASLRPACAASRLPGAPGAPPPRCSWFRPPRPSLVVAGAWLPPRVGPCGSPGLGLRGPGCRSSGTLEAPAEEGALGLQPTSWSRDSQVRERTHDAGASDLNRGLDLGSREHGVVGGVSVIHQERNGYVHKLCTPLSGSHFSSTVLALFRCDLQV